MLSFQEAVSEDEYGNISPADLDDTCEKQHLIFLRAGERESDTFQLTFS